MSTETELEKVVEAIELDPSIPALNDKGREKLREILDRFSDKVYEIGWEDACDNDPPTEDW